MAGEKVHFFSISTITIETRVFTEGQLQDFNAAPHPQHPKRLVCKSLTSTRSPIQTIQTSGILIIAVAPGDIKGPGPDSDIDEASSSTIRLAASHLAEDITRSNTSTPTSAMQQELLSHPARAHQFTINPPLHISQLHATNPLHQFHKWFKDPRIPRSSAPETCTLATASLPSGRISARMLYFKELDERGWVIYSNWGSKEGKGGQIFGREPKASPDGTMPSDMHDSAALNQGNRWAALTFFWSIVERQVRVEGTVEPLSREESEMYWRTRERHSQIGAWTSWQSKVLWAVDPDTIAKAEADLSSPDYDDGRAALEQRASEIEARFAGVKDIPLPPFWGGIRVVPESVEFWQGRPGRLHDRFRYVLESAGQSAKTSSWRIERLSP